MELLFTEFEGLFLIKHSVFSDERGYFLETFHQNRFSELGINFEFVQDNLSKSSKNVIRGLHLQTQPFEQGKLVRVVAGVALDVVLDLRRNSKSYGKHYKVILSDENKLSLWVPPGFAHGFASLEDNTIFSYKCTNYYSKANEQTILWNDEDLNIDWEVDHPIVSKKDEEGLKFSLFSSSF